MRYSLGPESEELVSKESMKIVSTTNRLVLADFNFKDVGRLRTFFKVGKDNDRKLVVDDSISLNLSSSDLGLIYSKFFNYLNLSYRFGEEGSHLSSFFNLKTM